MSRYFQRLMKSPMNRLELALDLRRPKLLHLALGQAMAHDQAVEEGVRRDVEA
jgi:hypothetical protein